MSTNRINDRMAAEVNRLMQRTIDALPAMALAPTRFRPNTLVGVDRDATEELLRRDGLLPKGPRIIDLQEMASDAEREQAEEEAQAK